MKIALPLSIALAVVAGFALAQGQPRGTATVILNKDILSAVEKTAKDAVNDLQIRIVSINSEYNVGVGVVHRARTAGRDIGGGIEHSEITEVYHMISGTGTLVTGGIDRERESDTCRQPGRSRAQRPEHRRRPR